MPFELVKINRVGSRRAVGARPWREERAAERVALTAIRSSRQGLLPEAAAGTLGTATQPLRCLGVLASWRFTSPNLPCVTARLRRPGQRQYHPS